MNKKIMSVMMLLVASLMVFGHENKEISFNYPIMPGTKEWSEYNSTLDRIRVLQIPESTLKKLSTESLLDICLDYPFLIEVCLDDNYQANFEIISSQFNGLQELQKRSDFFDVLLQKNDKLMDMASKMKDEEPTYRFAYSFQCFIIEFLMTQESIVGNFVYNGQLPEIFKKNQAVREQNEDVFWRINNVPSKILEEQNIISSSYLLTNRSGSYIATGITTPNGSTVSDTYVWQGTDIGPSDQEYISNMQTYSNHSSATIIEYPSKKYNCHGYAWHVSEGGSKVWIGLYSTTAEDIYWLDGSYIQVPEAIGDKVSYYGNHSAIRLSSTLYKSKWGSGVLATHAPNDVPSIYLNGSTTKTFYVKKPYNYFSGPALVTSSGTYSVSGLQSGYTVVWSLSDSYYDNNCIQKNYPYANQCVITCSSSHQMINATLTATIKKSGYTVTTLTKTVSAYTGFYGTYYNGQTTKQVNLPSPLYVLPSTYVTITSPNLIGASLSFQGSYIPSSWQHNSTTGTLQFVMPSTVGATLTITVSSNGDTYYLPVIVASSVYLMSVESSGDQISVFLTPDMGDDSARLSQQSSTDTAPWRLEVYNASTGRKVYDQFVTRLSEVVQTTGWKPGVYVVRASIGGQSFSEKIVVK